MCRECECAAVARGWVRPCVAGEVGSSLCLCLSDPTLTPTGAVVTRNRDQLARCSYGFATTARPFGTREGAPPRADRVGTGCPSPRAAAVAIRLY